MVEILQSIMGLKYSKDRNCALKTVLQNRSPFVLGVVRRQIVPDLLAGIDLPDHQVGSGEDNAVQLGNEPEKIRVESDPGTDPTVEVLDVIVRFKNVHVHRETFRPDSLHPEADDVAVVEEEELFAGSRIHHTPDSLPHLSALDGDFVRWQETEGQIATENGLDLIIIIVMIITGQAMTLK